MSQSVSGHCLWDSRVSASMRVLSWASVYDLMISIADMEFTLFNQGMAIVLRARRTAPWRQKCFVGRGTSGQNCVHYHYWDQGMMNRLEMFA
jgi:hypothetical protein